MLLRARRVVFGILPLCTQSGQREISGLTFSNGRKKVSMFILKTHTTFVPGAVGTLKKFGFREPPFAGFAGAVLILKIPTPPSQQHNYKDFLRWREIHKPGVVLSWQAKNVRDRMVIAVGGTKAFYGDKRPHVGEAFAVNRNLLQLNIANDTFPKALSWALNRDTTGQILTHG